MKTTPTLRAAFACLCLFSTALHAQVPSLINYQGRVAVNSVNFNGSGLFKFALVNPAGSTTYWSNDGTSAAGSEPTNAVSLTVSSGLYSALLGDTALVNMTAIPAGFFGNPDVRLRVWFNDGTNGFQLLTPDQRLAPSPYLADGSVASATIASGAVGNAKLAANAVGAGNIAAGAVGPAQVSAAIPVLTNASNTFTGALAVNNGLSVIGSSTFGNDLTINGNLNLPQTTASVGVIKVNGTRFVHSLGNRNTFVGSGAGNLTLSGSENSGLGFAALSSVTTGSLNTGLGSAALQKTTTGANNTAVGLNALRDNLTGGENTAVGAQSLIAATGAVGNTAVGSASLNANTAGNFNTAIGLNALRANTTGSQNTAMGSGALFSATANLNTAVGADALRSTTIGERNTAIGLNTLRTNSTGGQNTALGDGALFEATASFNTAIGADALRFTTTGESNTAIGLNTLRANTTGTQNTALGSGALISATANSNTALGSDALRLATTGDSNTAVGANALRSNTTGVSNIAVGISAGTNLTTGSNNIDIANVGVAGESATIRIGTQGTQTAAFIAGVSGATSTGGVAVYVDAQGKLGTLTSSRRFKEGIEEMGRGSEALLALQPVCFRYKPEIDAAGIPQFGLIAEEVAKVNPDLIVRDAAGEVYSVRYEAINAMLLNEFLKEHRKVDRQQATITDQQKEIETLAKRLSEVESVLLKVSAKIEANEL